MLQAIAFTLKFNRLIIGPSQLELAYIASPLNPMLVAVTDLVFVMRLKIWGVKYHFVMKDINFKKKVKNFTLYVIKIT